MGGSCSASAPDHGLRCATLGLKRVPSNMRRARAKASRGGHGLSWPGGCSEQAAGEAGEGPWAMHFAGWECSKWHLFFLEAGPPSKNSREFGHLDTAQE